MARAALCGAIFALCGLACGAEAQTYPQRTIKVVSPFAPGGGTDYIARNVAQHVGDANKWTMVVENRTGANGTLALGEIARADKSGHEIVVGQSDNLVLASLLTKVPFDSVKDFTPIALVAKTPIVFVVPAKSRFKTFADVVAAAKADPDKMTFGSSGIGSGTHLAAELMRLRADVRMRHVPYRGSTPALTDLLGGHVDVVGSSIASAGSLIRSGDVRPLAVTTPTRSTTLPDVPTLAELGIKGIDVSTWYGVLGPAGLPDDVVRTLNTEVNKMMQRKEIVSAFGEQGLEPSPDSPEAFRTLLKTDYERWIGILAELGMKRE